MSHCKSYDKFQWTVGTKSKSRIRTAVSKFYFMCTLKEENDDHMIELILFKKVLKIFVNFWELSLSWSSFYSSQILNLAQ